MTLEIIKPEEKLVRPSIWSEDILKSLQTKRERVFQDEQFMQECIKVAYASVKNSEAPFGSLITKGSQIVIASKNRIKRDNDVTNHAEIVAMREAQRKLGTNNLSGYTIYTICEPCPMCSFMIRELKFDRVVFSLPSPYMGGLNKWNILQDNDLSLFPQVFSTPPQITSNVLPEQALGVFKKAGWGKMLGRRKTICMPIKVFVLGGVGSGKSSAVDHVSELAKSKGIPHVLINPYDILKKWHQEDINYSRTKPIIKNGKQVGFKVTDLSMYDDVRIAVAEKIKERDVENRNEFVIVEYAARNYAESFRIMQEVYPSIFSNARFMFITKPIEKRMKDIENRNTSRTENSPYLDEELIKRFKDDGEGYITSAFKKDFSLTDNNVRVIENKGDIQTFQNEIDKFAKETLFPSIGRETVSPGTSIKGE